MILESPLKERERQTGNKKSFENWQKEVNEDWKNWMKITKRLSE